MADDRIEAVTPIDRQSGIYLYNARSSDTLRSAVAKQRAERRCRITIS